MEQLSAPGGRVHLHFQFSLVNVLSVARGQAEAPEMKSFVLQMALEPSVDWEPLHRLGIEEGGAQWPRCPHPRPQRACVRLGIGLSSEWAEEETLTPGGTARHIQNSK